MLKSESTTGGGRRPYVFSSQTVERPCASFLDCSQMLMSGRPGRSVATVFLNQDRDQGGKGHRSLRTRSHELLSEDMAVVLNEHDDAVVIQGGNAEELQQGNWPCVGERDHSNDSSLFRSWQEEVEGGRSMMTEVKDRKWRLQDTYVSGYGGRWPGGRDGSVVVLTTETEKKKEQQLQQEAGMRVSESEGWMEEEAEMGGIAVGSPGGRKVVDFIATWDALAPRLPKDVIRSPSAGILLAALKLVVPALQDAVVVEGGRLRVARALSLAMTLSDLQMDGETIATGLVREAFEMGRITVKQVEDHLGITVKRLLQDCMKVQTIPATLDLHDEENARALRRYCLSFHDVRAVIIEVVSKLDVMRHLQVDSVPRYRSIIVALETMQIYAPIAHSIGLGRIVWELEDIAFRVLFPGSYDALAAWVRSQWDLGPEAMIETCRKRLDDELRADKQFMAKVDSFVVTGRAKSLFSLMRKLLRDGRDKREVYDLLGLRIVVTPKVLPPPDEEEEVGVGKCSNPLRDRERQREREREASVCYYVRSIVKRIWEEIPERYKDYIGKPKKNGYQSLHMAVHTDPGHVSPPLELQIRSATMDFVAVSGGAAHGAYKGGITDPQQVKNLRMLMDALVNASTPSQLKTAAPFPRDEAEAVVAEPMGTAVQAMDPAPAVTWEMPEEDEAGDAVDHVFALFDRNGDGVISKEEFKQVMHELGAPGTETDVNELMTIVDSNTDGTVTAEEFQEFRRQASVLRNLSGADQLYQNEISRKLQCLDEGSERPGGGSRKPVAPTRHLYVANCGPGVGIEYEEVEQIFRKFGKLECVQPSLTSQSRTYVSFIEVAAAAAAYAGLNGVEDPCSSRKRIMHIEFAEVASDDFKVPPPCHVCRTSDEVDIPGLFLHTDFITPEEEKALLDATDGISWDCLSKRRVQHFGYEFKYKIRNVDRRERLGDLPAFVKDVVDRISLLPEVQSASEPCLPLDQLTA
ncbi:hypothetical protein CBR_g37166, partial [Chara braunii]